MAIHSLLKVKKPSPAKSTNLSRIANKLHPSSAHGQTNQFVLGRNDKGGALYQKFKHSQIQILEQAAEQVRASKPQDKQALDHWKTITNHRKIRLSKLATGGPPLNQDGWSEEVERSITSLIAYLGLFKTKQEQCEQTQNIRPSESAVKELLSSSYSPASDD